MKGKYPGVMPVKEFYQALYQDASFFDTHGIRYISNISIYFTPCDEFGDPVAIHNRNGDVVDGFISSGAYQCAADLVELKGPEVTDILGKPRFKVTKLKNEF
jgi:hypothetical protein